LSLWVVELTRSGAGFVPPTQFASQQPPYGHQSNRPAGSQEPRQQSFQYSTCELAVPP
jgi:hypothetical protein